MSLQKFITYCLQKNGATKNYPFGDDVLVMKVGNKMFALFGHHHGIEQISLKCEPGRAAALREQFPAIIPGYHLNKTHWNTVMMDGSLEDEQIESMIDHSYERVYSSLTKAEKAELAGRVQEA